jgi:hypothetical protein
METLTQLVTECMTRHGFPNSSPHEPPPRVEYARGLLLPEALPSGDVLAEPSTAPPAPLPSGF